MYFNYFIVFVKLGLGLIKVIYFYYLFVGEWNYDVFIFYGRVERVFIDDYNVFFIR